jgi:hypothetical protein
LRRGESRPQPCLPRRCSSGAHANRELLPFGDNNERRLNLHAGLAQRVDYCQHELSGDMARTQVHDSDKCCASANRGAPKSDVMCHDDAALTCRAFQNINVWTANQLLVPCRARHRNPAHEDPPAPMIKRKQSRSHSPRSVPVSASAGAAPTQDVGEHDAPMRHLHGGVASVGCSRASFTAAT